MSMIAQLVALLESNVVSKYSRTNGLYFHIASPTLEKQQLWHI